VREVADHIDHIKNLVGIDYVGLGSDFDGVGIALPPDLDDVDEFPNLIAELLRRGYSDEEDSQDLQWQCASGLEGRMSNELRFTRYDLRGAIAAFFKVWVSLQKNHCYAQTTTLPFLAVFCCRSPCRTRHL
jgi:hypothetical protein